LAVAPFFFFEIVFRAPTAFLFFASARAISAGIVAVWVAFATFSSTDLKILSTDFNRGTVPLMAQRDKYSFSKISPRIAGAYLSIKLTNSSSVSSSTRRKLKHG
jgi:hypothetical protein